MVVCKCRKATKLYCFVHKVPVCGECICFPEHQICVIWPPKSVKDSASRLHSLLKEAIMQTGMEKNLFGNHPVSVPTIEPRGPPPAFASDPLINVSSTGGREYDGNSSPSVAKDGHSAVGGSSKLTVTEIMEIDGPSSAYTKTSSPVAPVATTRKSTVHVDRQNSEISYYADDEDGNRKKYSRRGPLRHKFLRALIPFWSSALPTLPVTAPPRKDASIADDVPEGRLKHQRSTRMDPRKILLLIAIMACMATMGILYYRIAQRALGNGLADDEQQ
ncbi:uncharacterized protein LOC111295759 isoform X3 [Durio zibethinus]|uniref:Uncharacterized protein LOC111295759 isoform X3 n=1 Tax=Durio zibethinus TaxID=66656 RepID=A0A6P5YXG1_DURZI|nr:uncharacterized protein LOC111295759 isoform X3 [Durio zibethinus]